MSEAVTQAFAEVNGARLYYEVAGQGPALVLIHAGIADCRMWDEQVAAFAPRYKVIRYDNRGFGKSKMSHESFSVLEDLYQLLRFLDVDRANVLGLSMGGSIALSFTVEHPEMVASLIPVASGLRGYQVSEEVQRRRSRLDAAVATGDASKVVDLMTEVWVDGMGGHAEPTVRERARKLIEGNSGFFFLKGIPHHDPPWKTIDRIAEIRVPTLVVVGDRDQPDILAISDLLHARIRGARKVVIPDAAHLVNMEQAEALNRAVLGFLSGIGARA
ncbi:MAG: alpha/beta fold hydrolase [Armatimonadota bacterium]